MARSAGKEKEGFGKRSKDLTNVLMATGLADVAKDGLPRKRWRWY